MSTPEPVLQIRGLTKSFPGHLSLGHTQVLQGVDLTVRRGEIYGFIGANGAGKTTTIKILTGLVFADAGEVTVLGRRAPDPESRRGLGYLPEQPSFYGHLCGREFLDFQARLLGMATGRRRDEVSQRLRQVGMESRAGVPLRKCSKGMLQRIGIAQALLGDPELLVLDEPMSGLDPVGRRDVRDLILAQRQQGTTVFFSSHILSDAEVLCDRVGILSQGRVAMEGALDDMLEHRTDSWEVVVTRTAALTRMNGFRIVAEHGERLLLQVDGERPLAALLLKLEEAGAALHSVTPKRRTLEEHFLHLLEPSGPSLDKSS